MSGLPEPAGLNWPTSASNSLNLSFNPPAGGLSAGEPDRQLPGAAVGPPPSAPPVGGHMSGSHLAELRTGALVRSPRQRAREAVHPAVGPHSWGESVDQTRWGGTVGGGIKNLISSLVGRPPRCSQTRVLGLPSPVCIVAQTALWEKPARLFRPRWAGGQSLVLVHKGEQLQNEGVSAEVLHLNQLYFESLLTYRFNQSC